MDNNTTPQPPVQQPQQPQTPQQQPPSQAPQIPPQPMKKSTKIGVIVSLIFVVGIVLFAVIAGITQSIANSNTLDINVDGFRNGESRRGDRGLTASSKVVGDAREFTFAGNVENGGDDLVVTVAGQEATLNGEEFTITVPLESGANEIDVVAKSGDKEDTRSFTITTLYVNDL